MLRSAGFVLLGTLLVGAGLGGCRSQAPETPAERAAPAAAEGHSEAKAPGTPAQAPAVAGRAEQPALREATVTLWHSYRGAEQKALEQIVKTYNARGGPVRVQLVAVPYDAFVDKITVTVPRGAGPDLFIFAHNMIGPWARQGIVEPITQWAPPEMLEAYLPKTVQALVYERNLYGLPLAFKCVVLFYNRALVQQPPATMDALVATARKLTDSEQGRYGLVYEAARLYFHAPWLLGFGGTIFGPDGEVRIHTPEAVEALRHVRGLVREAGIVPKGMTSFMVTSLFNEGKAAFVINGPWFRGEIDPAVDYGVAPLPTLPGGRAPRPWLGSEAIFVSAHSAFKREAFDFARYLASDEAALVRATVGKQPVANRAIYGRPEVQRDAAMVVFLRQAEHAVPMPATAAMQAVWSTYDAALGKVLFGDADPDEALAQAQRKIAADVARQNP